MDSQYGLYAVGCDTLLNLPALQLSFAGRPFSLSGAQYTINVGGNKCLLGFVGQGETDPWLFGDVFMVAVYVVFDTANNRVGFNYLKSSY